MSTVLVTLAHAKFELQEVWTEKEKKNLQSSSPAKDLGAYARPELLPPCEIHVKNFVRLISPSLRHSNSQFLQVRRID